LKILHVCTWLDRQNDTTILIHYGFYGYIHSPSKDTKGEAELRGTNPKEIRFQIIGYLALLPVLSQKEKNQPKRRHKEIWGKFAIFVI